MSQCTRLTDRRTDGRTEFPSLYRDCISCSAVKTVMQNTVLQNYTEKLTPTSKKWDNQISYSTCMSTRKMHSAMHQLIDYHHGKSFNSTNDQNVNIYTYISTWMSTQDEGTTTGHCTWPTAVNTLGTCEAGGRRTAGRLPHTGKTSALCCDKQYGRVILERRLW